MSISRYEAWIQVAKPGEVLEYHNGYLARDRFYNNTVRDVANLFHRVASNNMVELYQKKLKHGSTNHDPVFQYLAKKI